MMITLPNRNSNAGVEVRILLAETRSPAWASYSLSDAKICMQLMHLVLWNRLENPGPFLAPGAKTLVGIVKAKGQFAGFANYPDYDVKIRSRIQQAIDIANAVKDSRSSDYVAYVQAAIDVSTSSLLTDPSPGKLVAWRTGGSGSPGSGFNKFKTVLGVDFYYQ